MNFPILFSKFNYYHYYSNNGRYNGRVLTMCESISPTDVIIAWRSNGNNSVKVSYLFFKFTSIKQFIDDCYKKLSEKFRRFYIVFTANVRCLYFDCDAYINDITKMGDYTAIIINTIVARVKFKYINITSGDIFIWHANRKIPNGCKISLHIIFPTLWFTLDELKSYVLTVKQKVDMDLEKLNIMSGIDVNVYNRNYQLWRLPYNHSGNPESMMIAYSHKQLTLYEQFNINKCYKNQTYRILATLSSGKKTVHSKIRENIGYLLPLRHEINKLFGNIEYVRINEFKYYIRGNTCPFSNRVHKGNGGIISIYTNTYKYISFKCLDNSDCGKNIYYISLTKDIHYPWLLDIQTLKYLNKTHKSKLDTFLWRMIGSDILYRNKFDNYEILIHKYIKCEYQQHYIHGILSQNIKCVIGHSSLELRFRKRTHVDWRFYRDIVIYCGKCNKFFY